MRLPVFHLAFPVRDLGEARMFYAGVLGARAGRETGRWIDVWLWGAQITLHERADEVPARAARGVRHFGAVLAWDEWERTAAALAAQGVAFASGPTVSHPGTPREQGKLLLEDPSGNLIELKAYRDPDAALEHEDLP